MEENTNVASENINENSSDGVLDFLIADAKEFMEKYPNIDIVELEKNPKFLKFSKGRLYKEPISEIYADYADFSREAEEAALEKARSKSSRECGSGGRGTAASALSAAQQKELDEWNRSVTNKGMRMSVREFLSR